MRKLESIGGLSLLPFLKKNIKPQVGVIIEKRAPDQSEDSQDPDAGMDACAQDLIDAIHNKDVKGVSAALKAAMECADMPEDDGSYDSQNIKTASEMGDE